MLSSSWIQPREMTIWSAAAERRAFAWLCVLISLLNFALAQREGYVSIDCGASDNSTDTDTGIEWTTDEPFISTGINEFLKSGASSSVNSPQLLTIRYFPENRNKHCYTLPAARDASYLVRASFLHGGFQAQTGNSFQLSIDANVVDSLAFTAGDVDSPFVFEYMVAATSNRINVCLLPDVGIPFINALELRPLAPGMYDVVFDGKYLKTLTRLNCGAKSTDPTVRYPDDLYDRVWFSPPSSITIATSQTTRNIAVPDILFDKPPEAVLQKAWVDFSFFWWSFRISDYELAKTNTFYVNLFFAETQAIKPTDTRIVDIRLNGEDYFTNFSVLAAPDQVYLKNQTFTTSVANYSFSANPDSTLGPTLNAGEIYASRDSVQSSTAVGDVDALDLVKRGLGLSSWTGDPCFPVAYDWLTCDKGATARITKINLSKFNLTGTIPASIAGLAALTDLWLDNNQLEGAIPDLSTLTRLRSIHLQNNAFSGGIPSTLASLPVLTELYLSNNQLSGPIPAALANRNGLDLQTSGNPNLCAPTESCKILPPSAPKGAGRGESGGGGGSSGAIIGGIVGGVIAAFVIIGLSVWCYCRKRPHTPLPVTKPITGVSDRVGVAPSIIKQARAFTLAEVEHATVSFKRKIGEGGFGPVFYGRLSDGTELAVKVNLETSGQGTTEFVNEVSLLSRVHHRNLVSLLGYCEENGQQILIYEFMSNGTLREHLYGKDMKGTIGWKQRLDIALSAAKGLEYLHNDCHPKIIHRDIKSNNILLDGKLMAKVADFGISKLAPDEDQTGGVSTIVRGTTGYLDPEYYQHNKLTQKSDVYSFGVVLLEIISARPPNNPNYTDPKEYKLVDWVRGQLNGNDLDSIVDPEIRGRYNVESMWKVAELAMGCVEPYGINRPDMKQVVRALTVALELDEGGTQSYGPGGKAATGGREHGTAATGAYSSTFNTESSYPSTRSSATSIPEYPTTGGVPSAPPFLFTPPATFARLPSDTRDSDSSWFAPKPR